MSRRAGFPRSTRPGTRAAHGAAIGFMLAILVGCAGSQVLQPPPDPSPRPSESHTPTPTAGPSDPGSSNDTGHSNEPGAPGTPEGDPGVPGSAEPSSPAPRPSRTATPTPTPSPTTVSGSTGDPTPSADPTPTTDPSPTTRPNPTPTPTPDPTATVPAWREAIFESRTGAGPERFTDRDPYSSCGDSESAPGTELLNPDLVECLDEGAGGAEAVIALLTETETFHVWFVRVGPEGAEYFIDSHADTGSWWYGTCDANPSIGHFDCTEPVPVPMTEPAATPSPDTESAGTESQTPVPTESPAEN